MTTPKTVLKIVPEQDAMGRAGCALEVVFAIADLLTLVPEVETMDPKTLPALGYHLGNLCRDIDAGFEEVRNHGR